MNFIIIFGPSAVGKMTVGKILAEHLDYKLFHNHVSIEFVRPFFDFGDKPFWDVVTEIRQVMVNALAEHKLNTIFTFVWDFDNPQDTAYIDRYVDLFEKNDYTVYFVELEVNIEERSRRNQLSDRIKAKPSKQNVEVTNQIVLAEENEKLNSKNDFLYPERHIKINSTNLTAEETAEMVIRHFDFRIK